MQIESVNYSMSPEVAKMLTICYETIEKDIQTQAHKSMGKVLPSEMVLKVVVAVLQIQIDSLEKFIFEITEVPPKEEQN